MRDQYSISALFKCAAATDADDHPFDVTLLTQTGYKPYLSDISAAAQRQGCDNASDWPHGLPPLDDLVGQAVGVYRLISAAEHPSSIVSPVLPNGV